MRFSTRRGGKVPSSQKIKGNREPGLATNWSRGYIHGPLRLKMRRLRFLSSALGLGALSLVAPRAQAALTLASGEPADDLTVTVLANGLAQPTDMAELPDGRVVITQREGDVVVVDANGDQIESGHITV